MFVRILTIALLFVSEIVFSQQVVTSTNNKFPVPPPSAVRLFYIQRSSNSNVVVYDANLVNKKYETEKPIRSYWMRMSEKGQKESLSLLQRTLAYGYDNQPIPNEPNNVDVTMVSYKKRRIKLSFDAAGNPVALFQIAGKVSHLNRVWVQIEETGNLIPRILFVELFGRDPKTGAEVYERFKP